MSRRPLARPLRSGGCAPLRRRIWRAARLAGLLAALAVLAAPAAAQLVRNPLYVADPDAGAVFRLDAETGARSVVASGGQLESPTGLVVEPESGDLFVADRDAGPGDQGALVRVDPEAFSAADPGANQTPISSAGELQDPEAVAIEREGTVVVADAGGLGGVIRVDPADGAQQRLADIPGANGIAVDADGTLFVTTGLANELLSVDPLTGDTTIESAQGDFTALQDVAIEVDGLVLVLDLDGELIRVAPDAFDTANPGANQEIVSTGGNLQAPSSLAITELNAVLVGDPDAQAGAGAVIEVDEVDGDQSVLAAGDPGASPPFTRPAGIAVGRRAPVAGQIFVADLNGELVRADPATGEQAMVSRRGFFTGNKAVAIEADGRVLVVSSGFAEPGRVVRVDPVTGRQQVLSLEGDFNSPESIALAPDGTIFVGDSAAAPFPPSEAGAIFAIDPETGTQTLVATAGSDDDFRVLGMDLDPATGDFLVTTTNSAFDAFSLRRVDADSGAKSTLFSGPALVRADGVLVDPADRTVLVTTRNTSDAGADAVLEFDPAGGPPMVLADDTVLAGPRGLAFDADGDLLVGDFQRIIRVDRESGVATIVVEGGALNDSRDVALVPEPPARAGAAAALLALAALARRGRRTLVVDTTSVVCWASKGGTRERRGRGAPHGASRRGVATPPGPVVEVCPRRSDPRPPGTHFCAGSTRPAASTSWPGPSWPRRPGGWAASTPASTPWLPRCPGRGSGWTRGTIRPGSSACSPRTCTSTRRCATFSRRAIPPPTPSRSSRARGSSRRPVCISGSTGSSASGTRWAFAWARRAGRPSPWPSGGSGGALRRRSAVGWSGCGPTCARR